MFWFVLHWPWLLQLPGQPSRVQCLPFQPGTNVMVLKIFSPNKFGGKLTFLRKIIPSKK
jgi:hypothetical protein